MTKIPPSKLNAFFVVTATIHLLSSATRFDALGAHLSPAIHAGILFAQFPLLLVAGLFEGLIDYGDTLESLPMWMRIRSVPVKASFTFAFVYLSTVVLQTLHFSIGPLDPTPPLEWPLERRAMWFAIFTLGMFFPFYLAATGTLIPTLRTLTKPFQRLPLLLSAVVLFVLGLALGLGVLTVLGQSSGRAQALAASIDAFKSQPIVAFTWGIGRAHV